jgi:predicted acyltransferase
MASTALSPTSEIAAAKSGSGRLLSLDVFRGATILAMILVNNPGQWGKEHQYWPLDHAEWHGWTPTDLIFPFFLFIVGTSLAYSLRKYRDGAQIAAAVYWRIVRRTLLLIFLGWMPTLLSKTIGAFHSEAFDLSNLRIFGVLVRIALVYFCASLIVLHVPLRGQILLGIAILAGYCAVLTFLPDPHHYAVNLTREGNVVGAIDRSLIGPQHMWSGDRVTEPEGLLSTLPAIVTALMGYWSGLIIQRRGVNYRTVIILAACGLACAALGQGWDYYLHFPINKKLWTSSFVLLTGGLAMVVLAGCLMKFDIWGWRRLARPFEIVGINAIFVFVASGLLVRFVLSETVGGETIHNLLYHNLFTSWIHDPKLASLGFALLTVAFWWFVCWVMSKLGWAIRV